MHCALQQKTEEEQNEPSGFYMPWSSAFVSEQRPSRLATSFVYLTLLIYIPNIDNKDSFSTMTLSIMSHQNQQGLQYHSISYQYAATMPASARPSYKSFTARELCKGRIQVTCPTLKNSFVTGCGDYLLRCNWWMAKWSG